MWKVGQAFFQNNFLADRQVFIQWTMTKEKNAAGNSGLAKVAVQYSADTFEVNQTLVLRINICGENRHLRQAAKRRHLVGEFESYQFYYERRRNNTWK